MLHTYNFINIKAFQIDSANKYEHENALLCWVNWPKACGQNGSNYSLHACTCIPNDRCLQICLITQILE